MAKLKDKMVGPPANKGRVGQITRNFRAMGYRPMLHGLVARATLRTLI